MTDELIPFNCAITNKYHGSEIMSLNIGLDDINLDSIPLSLEVCEKLDRRLLNNIRKAIIQEIKIYTTKNVHKKI